MEQLYLVEVFINELTIFMEETESTRSKIRKITDRNFICKVKFGPKIDFLIKDDPNRRRDQITKDESNREVFKRMFRQGKSYLFPSYPEIMKELMENNPMEIQVFNDDNEIEGDNIFVGIATMLWETPFYVYLKDTMDTCRLHKPLSTKYVAPLMAECCCRQIGSISFIVRISALGFSIMTDFKQMMGNPDHFLFATNHVPSVYECYRMENSDPNFKLVGSLYTDALLNDPQVIARANKHIEVCTELQSCGVKQQSDRVCGSKPADSDCEPGRKTYPIDSIKMGDIKGPCGNPNCELANRVKTYIKNLDSYAKDRIAQSDSSKKEKGKVTNKVCGACSCKDDKYHHEEMQEVIRKDDFVVCKGCGGHVKPGSTCQERKDRMYNTGVTPTGSRIFHPKVPK